MKTLSPSGIKSVHYFKVDVAETCDRCSQGIKNVAAVKMADGEIYRFGLDCINKVLAGDTSLKSLFKKNAALLAHYQECLNILNGEEADMPRAQEYYGSGLYFIASADGKIMRHGRAGSAIWHPLSDYEKNATAPGYRLDGTGTGGRWRADGSFDHYSKNTPENFMIHARFEMGKARIWFQEEVSRLSLFLAKVLRSGILKGGTLFK